METDTAAHSFARGLQLRHLRCLVAVARERHLARAAARLSVSQPAVSKTMAELEALAGERLVERAAAGRRGIRGLTVAGERLLGHALAVLDAVQAGADALWPADRQRTERLRLGVLPSAAPALMAAALARLRERQPLLAVEVHTDANDRLLEGLRAGEHDLVVGRMSEPRLMQGLAFELLRMVPLVAVVRAGHPRAGSRRGLPALLDLPWLVYPEGTVPRHHVRSLLSAHGLDLPVALLQTLDPALARGILLHSDAVWFTPLDAVMHDLAAGHLVRLRLDTAGTEEPVGLLRRNDAPPSPGALALAVLLRAPETRRRARPA